MFQFLYFKDCPNYKKTLENLKDALSQLKIEESRLEIIEVKSIKDAEYHNFLGSPTILLDDIDLYPGNILQKPNLSCRLYNVDGIIMRILPTNFLLKLIDDFYIRRHH